MISIAHQLPMVLLESEHCIEVCIVEGVFREQVTDARNAWP